MYSLFSVPFVAVIGPGDRSRSGRERLAFVSSECLARFVKTDDWTLLVVGFVVEAENIFHEVDEVSVLFWWNLPVTGEMRFQGVFLYAVGRPRERSTRSRSR